MFIIIQATWKYYKRIGGSVSGIYKHALERKELEKRYKGYKEKIKNYTMMNRNVFKKKECEEESMTVAK